MKTEPSNKIIFFGLLIIVSLSIYVSYKYHYSYVQQFILLNDFNNNKSLTSNDIKKGNYNENFPNLAATAIPLNNLKHYYFIKENRDLDSILNVMKNSKNINPYIYFNESLIADIYQRKENIDSVLKYRKIAFYGLPNNSYHSQEYIKAVQKVKDSIELDNIFKTVNVKNKLFYVNYLNALGFVSSNKLKKLNFISTLDSLLVSNPEEEFFYNQLKLLLYSRDNYIKVNEIKLIAEKSFSDKKYEEALKHYNKIIKLDSINNYSQNLAEIYFQLGKYERVLDNLNFSEIENYSNDVLLIYGTSFLALKQNEKACFIYRRLRKLKDSRAKELLKAYCN